MAYNALNNLIDAYIYANGVQAITGQILNGVLKQMVSQLGSGYHLMGVAGPETTPEQNDFAMAYFAATAGEYTDFGGITLAAGEVAVLLTSGNGSWSKQTIYNVPTTTEDLENTANFITNAVTDLVNYYTKEETDTILADYPTLEALATALADYYTKTEINGQMGDVDTALADRYTKSETDTKLGDYYKKAETYDKDEVDSIVAALSRQEYVVAWDGTTAPDVSTIPAGVTVTYSGTPYTGTLAASASTVNKIYMVWNGVAYDMYGTSQDGGYSWVPMGTTSVDLSQYATKAELSQLQQEVTDNICKVSSYEELFKQVSSPTGSVSISSAGLIPGEQYYLLFDLSETKTFEIFLQSAAGASGPRTQTIAETTTWAAGSYILPFVFVSGGLFLRMGTSDVWGAITNIRINNGIDELKKDVKRLVSVSQGNLPYIKLSFGKNLFYTEWLTVGYRYLSNGLPDTVSGTSRAIQPFYIPVEPNTTYVFSTGGVAAAVSDGNAYHCFYDKDFNFISAVAGSVTSFTTPANAAYLRFSVIVALCYPDTQLEQGSITDFELCNPLSGYYIPINSNQLQDESVTPGKTSFFDVSANLYDSSEGLNGYYIGAISGNITDNENLKVSGYIPVTPGKQYCCNNSADAQGFCFYNANKEKLSWGPMSGEMIAPKNASYLRVTLYIAQDGVTNIVNEGASVATYTPFSQKINPKYLPETSFENSKQLKSILGQQADETTASSISPGGSLSLLYFPGKLKKQLSISFQATISVFDKVVVGCGDGVPSGLYLEIDSTAIKFYGGPSLANFINKTHGLSVSNFIKVVVTIDNNGDCFVILNTFSGYYMTTVHIYTYVTSFTGTVFARSNGSSLTDAKLNATSVDLKKPVWGFGDSYFGIGNEHRWPYHICTIFKYSNMLLSALGGDNSADEFAELQKCLSFGTPKYLLWCLGMNDADPSTAEVNASWLSYVQQVITICEQNNIVPILATIPNTPTRPHIAKNAWIKSSGYRYIDFAKSVGGETFVQDTDTWYGAGTANDYLEDGATPASRVHPTPLGAKALATQVLVDFPELLEYGFSTDNIPG